MNHYIYPGIVSSLALLVCYYTLLRSGLARRRFKIEPPAHTGPEEYERYVRAHQNTIEHLVLFLPGLWLFSLAVDPVWAAAIGATWLPGRLLYAHGYYKSAPARRPGLLSSMPAIYILVLGSLIGFIVQLVCG